MINIPKYPIVEKRTLSFRKEKKRQRNQKEPPKTKTRFNKGTLNRNKKGANPIIPSFNGLEVIFPSKNKRNVQSTKIYAEAKNSLLKIYLNEKLPNALNIIIDFH